jgi:hypothetical protein
MPRPFHSRSLLASLGVVGANAVLALGAAASATAAPAIGGCPPTMDLVTLEGSVAYIDFRPFVADGTSLEKATQDYLNYLADKNVDSNGDNLICVRHFVTNQGRDKHFGGFQDYVVTGLVDNRSVGHL